MIVIQLRSTTTGGNINLINQDRIDAFVAFIPDAYQAFNRLGLKPFPHAPDHPLAFHNDSLVCRGVRGARLLGALDAILRQEAICDDG